MFESVTKLFQRKQDEPARAAFKEAVAHAERPEVAGKPNLSGLLSPGPNAVPPIDLSVPINWDDEQRVDLPPRSPERIKFLLGFETSTQTAARIANDKARYLNQQTGRSAPNPQSAIIPAEVQYSGNVQWTKR